MANTRQIPLTVPALQVVADVTYMPMLVDRSAYGSNNLDGQRAEMFNGAGSFPARADGGNLRFYANADQTGELAREIVSFGYDAVSGAAVVETDQASVQIWVSGSGFVLSSAADTTFYCEYGDGALVDYADTNPYGRDAVYDSNYVGVYHMEEDPSGTAPQIIDSSGNGNHGTTSGSMTGSDLVSSKIGKGLNFDGVDDYVDLGDVTGVSGATALTVQVLATTNDLNKDNSFVIKSNNFGTSGPFILWRDEKTFINSNNNSLSFFVVSDTTNTRVEGQENSLNDNNPHFITATFIASNGTGLKLFLDGSVIGTSSTIGLTSLKTSSDEIRISAPIDLREHNGTNSCTRISIIARSAFWIATEYNNQNSPSTFIQPGLPVALGGGLILKSASDIFNISITDSVNTLSVMLSTIDTISTSIAEVSSSLSALNRTDSYALALSESLNLFATLTTTDGLSLTIAESRELLGAIAASDEVAASISEGATLIDVALLAVDTLNITFVDAVQAIFSTVITSDDVSLTVTDFASIFSAISVADTVTVSLAEIVSLVKSISTSDTLDLSITESIPVLNLAISVSDVLAVSLTDSVLAMFGVVNSNDNVSVSLDDVTSLLVTLNRTDTLGLSLTETDEILTTLSALDALSVSITDAATRAAIGAIIGKLSAKLRIYPALSGKLKKYAALSAKLKVK